jgi:hypothetical protein
MWSATRSTFAMRAATVQHFLELAPEPLMRVHVVFLERENHRLPSHRI